MKVCRHCDSTAFADAMICYACGNEFDPRAIQDSSFEDLGFEGFIDEPCASLALKGGSARFHVAVPDMFSYDIYMNKTEGSELKVGCASDNNIVLPHLHSRRHPMRIFYSEQEVWVEDKRSRQRAELDGTPLIGTKSIQEGSTITLGGASIKLIEV